MTPRIWLIVLPKLTGDEAEPPEGAPFEALPLDELDPPLLGGLEPLPAAAAGVDVSSVVLLRFELRGV
jgi:hypothetical protein